MNGVTLVVLILNSCSTLFWQDSRTFTDMHTIRQEYIEAINSDTKTDALLKKLSDTSSEDALLIAYRGATEALKAKHAFNPYTKLHYLKKSDESLQKAIQMQPQEIEIRFLRFSIQHYLPAFLRSDKDLEQDKSVIVDHITDQQVEPALKQSIAKFMIESGRCTQPEIRRIQAAIGN